MKTIRKAELKDISRIAEILIFTKRATYRPIFQNDKVSFGEMQVVPLAREFEHDSDKLNNIRVYDDEFVKGLIILDKTKTDNNEPLLEIEQLYVEPFFHQKGIGCKLIQFAIETAQKEGIPQVALWVLEKNSNAISFYGRMGFKATGERKTEEGTDEFLIRMVNSNLRGESVPWTMKI